MKLIKTERKLLPRKRIALISNKVVSDGRFDVEKIFDPNTATETIARAMASMAARDARESKYIHKSFFPVELKAKKAFVYNKRACLKFKLTTSTGNSPVWKRTYDPLYGIIHEP